MTRDLVVVASLLILVLFTVLLVILLRDIRTSLFLILTYCRQSNQILVDLALTGTAETTSGGLCPTCQGKGEVRVIHNEIDYGNKICPDCGGKEKP